jgi:hypothetical protein
MKITPEEVGSWFFRLNGFLTIKNFVVHPDDASGQNTDADIMGVRFPHRAELFHNSMPDDEIFTKTDDKPYVIFSEIKKGRCTINSALIDREKRNLERLLKAVGVFKLNERKEVADRDIMEALYSDGLYSSDAYLVSLFCLGDSRNEDLADKYPKVPQVTWDHVFSFISKRFNTYRSLKGTHSQWDDTGKFLYNATGHMRNASELFRFVSKLWTITERI